jgi:hypothetical protein
MRQSDSESRISKGSRRCTIVTKASQSITLPSPLFFCYASFRYITQTFRSKTAIIPLSPAWRVRCNANGMGFSHCENQSAGEKSRWQVELSAKPSRAAREIFDLLFQLGAPTSGRSSRAEAEVDAIKPIRTIQPSHTLNLVSLLAS